MNVEKVAGNVAHACIIGSLSWIAAHPGAGWDWSIIALGWLGQCLTPPDLTKGIPLNLERKP